MTATCLNGGTNGVWSNVGVCAAGPACTNPPTPTPTNAQTSSANACVGTLTGAVSDLRLTIHTRYLSASITHKPPSCCIPEACVEFVMGSSRMIPYLLRVSHALVCVMCVVMQSCNVACNTGFASTTFGTALALTCLPTNTWSNSTGRCERGRSQALVTNPGRQCQI